MSLIKSPSEGFRGLPFRIGHLRTTGAVLFIVVQAERLVAAGERDAASLTTRLKGLIAARHRVRLDYLELRDAGSLAAVSYLDAPALLAVAARVGATRLIDNTLLVPGSAAGKA